MPYSQRGPTATREDSKVPTAPEAKRTMSAAQSSFSTGSIGAPAAAVTWWPTPPTATSGRSVMNVAVSAETPVIAPTRYCARSIPWLSDLLSHGIDLAQYLVGAITGVSALTATFITERPEVAVGGVGHQVTAAAGAPMLPVENEDWAALMVRFASGAVGTFESSRVAVGPRCEYGIAVYGTEGSLVWDFERINEIQVCQRGETYGYTRVLTDPSMGDFGRFQVGAGLG